MTSRCVMKRLWCSEGPLISCLATHLVTLLVGKNSWFSRKTQQPRCDRLMIYFTMISAGWIVLLFCVARGNVPLLCSFFSQFFFHHPWNDYKTCHLSILLCKHFCLFAWEFSVNEDRFRAFLIWKWRKTDGTHVAGSFLNKSFASFNKINRF